MANLCHQMTVMRKAPTVSDADFFGSKAVLELCVTMDFCNAQADRSGWPSRRQTAKHCRTCQQSSRVLNDELNAENLHETNNGHETSTALML